MARLLEVEDLRVTFRTSGGEVSAVNGVGLHVDEGETLAIVGGSGRGKSRTAYAATGLLAANGSATGRVRFVGRELLRLRQPELNRVRHERDRHDLPGRGGRRRTPARGSTSGWPRC